MDSFFTYITWFGSLLLLLPLSVLLGAAYFFHHRGTEGVFLLLSLIGASAITHLLKIIIARPRPEPENILVEMPPDFSFPSAHTSQATAFFLALCLVFARQTSGLPIQPAIWTALLLTAALVGYSRIYLQVHFLTDVLAGAAVGMLWVLFLAKLFGMTVRG